MSEAQPTRTEPKTKDEWIKYLVDYNQLMPWRNENLTFSANLALERYAEQQITALRAELERVTAENLRLRDDNQWLRSNFCEHHQEVCTMSSGPCGLCESKLLREALEHALTTSHNRQHCICVECEKARKALRGEKP